MITPVLPERAPFRSSIDGKFTDLYILRNGQMEAAITNYGGRLVSLIVTGPGGERTNTVLGYDNVRQYADSAQRYVGATIGRYGGRIRKGQFTLDGKQYQITINNGENALHGGKNGFQYRVWDAVQPNDHTLELSYLSEDGEEGFPGNLAVRLTYMLAENNELILRYEAETDHPTVLSLTNHSFFNLNGEGSGPITNHILQINADNYSSIDEGLLPTGNIDTVSGTPFDFTVPAAIGQRINEDNQQLRNGKGYDHNFVLNRPSMYGSNGIAHAASVIGDLSGIRMEVFTEEPGMQFYSGNFLQGANKLRTGVDEFRSGFCLETQHFPDSPNHDNFPSTVLRPGEKYMTRTVLRFSH